VPPTAFLIQWFITWVILAVVFFVAAESIQRYLYETPVEKLAWRVLAVTPFLAAVLVKWPLPFQNIFFNMTVTAGQSILWFFAFWLALRFQWQHAAVAALVAIVPIGSVTSSSIESLVKKWIANGASTKAAPAATTPATPAGSNSTSPAASQNPATPTGAAPTPK